MKAIVKIGYQDLLVPDVKTATKLVEMLATAVPVHERIYEGKVVLQRDPLRMEMQIVPDTVTWLQERTPHDPEPEPVTEGEAHPNRARALGAGGRVLQLPPARRKF